MGSGRNDWLKEPGGNGDREIVTQIAGVRIKRADGHYYAGTADHNAVWTPRASYAALYERIEDAETRMRGMAGLAVEIEAVGT